ncbi:hypothetical protein [Janthinobacterium agaricidamnosum]|uniref:Uncharacterized protein n=1 Tax=Janthinobacterium agaricidamnosum NBRC 102515 = DSM 9628 TaxID=1349767 RepID=W0V066_9BURK|nr:hypothetical protein [Janthinobacterium agaricidamnosum]CDG80995.1 hypothetical protein GJA_334 [Janthinobacterium agaricidamnosum NBRC 102515 = DSM 9628]
MVGLAAGAAVLAPPCRRAGLERGAASVKAGFYHRWAVQTRNCCIGSARLAE